MSSQFIKSIQITFISLIVSAAGACASSQSSTIKTESVSTQNSQSMVCPISGKPVTDESIYKGYFNSTPVYFASASDSTQYGSMPLKQRAKLAAPQVLAQKQITTTTCPLPGETLTANAEAVKYDGSIYGFASAAEANQFRSLPKPQQAKVIAAWKSDQEPKKSPAAKDSATK